MDIEDQISHLEGLMHVLLYADVVPNTFGLTGQVASTLQAISAAFSGKELVSQTKKRLDEVLSSVENNRPVFAIPETFLIERVYQHARDLRAKLGNGPFAQE